MLVAPASSAFSNSSLTAVARSNMTCPLAMRCTAAAGTGAMCPCIYYSTFGGYDNRQTAILQPPSHLHIQTGGRHRR